MSTFGSPGGQQKIQKPIPFVPFRLPPQSALHPNLIPAQNAVRFLSITKVPCLPRPSYKPAHNQNLTSSKIQGECKPLMAPYLRCLRAHHGTNAPECRAFAKAYLQCRMERYDPKSTAYLLPAALVPSRSTQGTPRTKRYTGSPKGGLAEMP